jgi:hypothetical protein
LYTVSVISTGLGDVATSALRVYLPYNDLMVVDGGEDSPLQDEQDNLEMILVSNNGFMLVFLIDLHPPKQTCNRV